MCKGNETQNSVAERKFTSYAWSTMAKKKAVGVEQPLLIETTETEAGIQWLHSLPETEVRDRVFMDLFRRMQAEGVIEGYEKIHGRNDKGVDFLVSQTSIFGHSIRGIQVKSKRMTRSESSGALSAVRVRAECEAAMMHEFHFQGRMIRLAGIDVWCSSLMTEDAERELNPPGAPHPVGVKKDYEILLLVEKYCPTLLAKVPQFAIAKYISECRNPGPKAVRILGCNLNPSLHFIEPFFSTQAPSSVSQIKAKNGTLQAIHEKIALQSIVSEKGHAIICAPPLSGRTYLLEHLRCKFSEAGHVSLIIKGSDLPNGDFKPENLVAQRLGFASPKQIKDLQQSSNIVLLVDDIDRSPIEAREKLLKGDSKLLRVVGTARSVLPSPLVRVFYQIGVDWLNIVRFLRSVDSKRAAGKPFVDRAKGFIDRAFESSGLPKNPFTIAVMLEECQHSLGKFSTPTMGRLIGRFIELQLGSHTDTTYVVDFETKREFLTRLAGHARYSFSIQEFEKLLGKFIDAKGHPHSITDFSNDLLHSGVFERAAETVEWAHPVIKEYFWVKNLVSKNKLAPLQKRLESDFNTTLAALAGSQLEDAGALVQALVPRISKVILPTFNELVASPEVAISLSKVITDKDEEKLLAEIESEMFFKEPPPAQRAASTAAGEKDKTLSVKLSKEQQLALKKRLEPLARQLAESRLHQAFNLAALVLNARDTSRNHKEQTVDAVISACKFLAQFMEELVGALLPDSKKIEFLSAWLRVITLCVTADAMLGDPHLVSIFRSSLKASKDQGTTFALLDLLLCCGEDENARILAALEKTNHLGVTMAFYWRVAMLYFFRYHRDVDRASLSKLMTAIRNMVPSEKVTFPRDGRH